MAYCRTIHITVFPANLYQAVNNIPVAALPYDPPLKELQHIAGL